MPEEFNLKVQILGDRSLIPDDIMEVVLRLERITANNTKGVLNICFPYTSRDDITQAMTKITKQVEQKELAISDIDVKLLEDEMYMGDSPRLGMMVRTSGATRFSDFMIWQSCENCQVEFIDTLWPAFSKWEMAKLLLKWGYNETRKLRSEEIRQTKRNLFEKKMIPSKTGGLNNSTVKKPPVISCHEVERSAVADVTARTVTSQ